MTEKNYLNDSKRQLLVTAALPYANGKIYILGTWLNIYKQIYGFGSKI